MFSGFALSLAVLFGWQDVTPQGSAQQTAASAAIVASASQPGSKIDPAVEKILLRWGRSMEGVERIECRFDRFRYDDAFAVEFRAKGDFSVDQTGVADYSCEPLEIAPGAVSRRKDGAGQSFTLLGDDAETMRITKEGATFTHGKGEAPTPFPFNRFPLAPFLVNVSRRELAANFDIRLVSQTQSEVRLELIPNREPYRTWYSRAELILKSQDFTPVAVRTFDPAGSMQTVHVLRDVKRVVKARP